MQLSSGATAGTAGELQYRTAVLAHVGRGICIVGGVAQRSDRGSSARQGCAGREADPAEPGPKRSEARSSPLDPQGRGAHLIMVLPGVGACWSYGRGRRRSGDETGR